MDFLSDRVLCMENEEMISKEVSCVYCGKKVMSRHIKLYVCNECYIRASNGKI